MGFTVSSYETLIRKKQVYPNMRNLGVEGEVKEPRPTSREIEELQNRIRVKDNYLSNRPTIN